MHYANLDPNNLWDKLFTITRSSNCEKTRVYDDIINEYYRNNDIGGMYSSKFYWVKQWGYGPVSYLFDYLDSALRDDIVSDFKEIYMNISSWNNKPFSNYTDSLDLSTKKKNPRARLLYAKYLKEYDQKVNSGYFKYAINTIQLHIAMPKLGWWIPDKKGDYAREFILKYDIDGDGRLNARELILGAIRENKFVFNNKHCTLCFKKSIAKIDAIFSYLNCAHTGYIDAEQMWGAFPLLNRPTSQYNIFNIKNNYSIRTNSVNDLVLKNYRTKDGFLNKDEFRQGILLGFWDRQTTQSGIIKGDSRNLKSLRWSDDGMIDTVAYNYFKESLVIELKQKAEERKQNMVHYKKQKQINKKTIKHIVE